VDPSDLLWFLAREGMKRSIFFKHAFTRQRVDPVQLGQPKMSKQALHHKNSVESTASAAKVPVEFQHSVAYLSHFFG
jgi:hypothetical protein